MDYCSSCRRHLNGALVCPGCGAYAPDIAPPMPTSVLRPAEDRSAFHDARYDGGSAGEHREASRFQPSGESRSDLGDAGTGVAAEVPVSKGRAARRRQLARWKKNKRRAAVATAVALVGGGLTLTAMDRLSPARVQAAAAPDDRPMGEIDDLSDLTPPSADPGGAQAVAGAHSGGSHASRGGAHRQDQAWVPDSRTASGTVPVTSRNPITPGGGSASTSTSASSTGTGTGTAGSGSGSGTATGGGGTSTTPPSQAPGAPTGGSDTGSGSGSGSGSDSGAGGGSGSGGGASTGTTPSEPPASTPPPSSDPSAPAHHHDQLCLIVACIG